MMNGQKVVKVFCHEEKSIEEFDRMNDDQMCIRDSSNGVLFLPYLMGERAPRWNPAAKGAFLGLTAETSRSDMLRSVLEGVALNLAIVLDLSLIHI